MPTKKPLPTPQKYARKVFRSFMISLLMIAISLGIGMLGYHIFAQLNFTDSLLNASMILTGMGPVTPMTTTAGKLFASFYALFSGIAFLTIAATMYGPVVHRFLHRFHLEITED